MIKAPKHQSYPDKIDLTLLLLLRRAISGSQELPEALDAGQWLELFRLSENCGVSALAYDGLSGLPEELLPPRESKVRQAVKVMAIEDRYALQKDVIIHLYGFVKLRKMRMLLLNGLGNASYYPVPEHREGSDVDIYTFDESFMVDNMISERGIKVTKSPDFSSDFEMGGVPVENHHHFFNVRTSPLNRSFEQKLQTLLSASPERRQLFNGIALPTPEENVYIMSLRILNKFAMGSATLRHLCDWTIFLRSNALNISFNKFNDFLRQNGLYDVVNCLNEICISYLGLGKEFRMPTAHRDLDVETEMLSRMLRVRRRVRGKVYSFKEKKAMLRAISWNYHLVHEDNSFWIVVLKTLLSH